MIYFLFFVGIIVVLDYFLTDEDSDYYFGEDDEEIDPIDIGLEEIEKDAWDSEGSIYKGE